MKYMNNHYGVSRVFGNAHFKMPVDIDGGEGGAGGGGAGGSSASGDAGADGKDGAGDGGKTGEGDQGVSFDDFLKNPKNQAEFDRRIAKALETNKTKLQADFAVRLENERTEAEKMAKMNADQKAQYAREKKEKELTDRETAITKRELKATAIEQLAEKNLPTSLAEVLNYASAEECKASIEAVGKAFQEAVEKAVETRLAGGKPPKKAPDGNEATLEQQIMKAMKGE